jgi:hypothetical protein
MRRARRLATDFAARLAADFAAPLLAGIAAWGAAAAAGAHPGHGAGGGSHSWLHYLGEPAHVALPLLVAVAFALGLRRARRRA